MDSGSDNYLDRVIQCVDDIIRDSENRNSFMRRFYESIGWEEKDFFKFISDNNERIRFRLSSADPSEENIPKILHRVWISDPCDPILPPADYTDDINKSAIELSSDWVQIICVNSELLKKKLSKVISDRIKVIQIDESDFKYGEILISKIDIYVQEKKFVIAADIARIMVVHQYGGFYADFGIIISPNILELARKADYTFIVGNRLFFQNSFFGAKKNSDVFELFIYIIDYPAAHGAEYIMDGNVPTGLDELQAQSGPGLTAIIILLLFNTDSVSFILPWAGFEYLTWRSQKSWYGEAKNGNVLINDAASSFLHFGDIIESEKIVNQNMHVYCKEKAEYILLKILLKIVIFSSKNMTKFEILCVGLGGDKVGDWHNYGIFYNFYVKSKMRFGDKLNEIVQCSNIGYGGSKLEQSLSLWRKFLKNDAFDGRIRDKNLLFTEARDQFSEYCASDKKYDIDWKEVKIFIDDSLHIYEENIKNFEYVYAELKEGSIYIIEDVRLVWIDVWVKYLKGRNIKFNILCLPHERNHRDNNIILTYK